MLNVLLIGNGGREHAMAWKLSQSKQLQRLYVAPGNAGTALEANTENTGIDACDIEALLAFVREKKIDLTLVGPEAPLAKGIVNRFQEQGFAIFGPRAEAAQLESSKAFSKDFMKKYQIPTAHYQTFENPALAKDYLKTQTFPLVLKADGLAAGKGVIIAQTQQEAEDAIEQMMSLHTFGSAGDRIVIEEFLAGEEASYIVMVDGEHALPFASSQDHKARDNGDQGPNTGGMGAYSPAPVITPELEKTILETVINPVIAGMKAEGHPYTGFLYAGLMIAPDNSIKVLEFNCRLGDPETQPLMMRLQSDLITLCQQALAGELHHTPIQWDPRVAVGVVACAEGYPNAYQTGQNITGLNTEQEHAKLFLAGVHADAGHFLTQGGRVLCATALAPTATLAQKNAYQLLNKVHFNGIYYRTDIGYRAVERERALK
jgi:phosphoribosylamine--glycine ligase